MQPKGHQEAPEGDFIPGAENDNGKMAAELSGAGGTVSPEDAHGNDMAAEALELQKQRRRHQRYVFYAALACSVIGLASFYYSLWFGFVARLAELEPLTLIAVSLSGLLPTAVLISLVKNTHGAAEGAADKKDLEIFKDVLAVAKLLPGRPH